MITITVYTVFVFHDRLEMTTVIKLTGPEVDDGYVRMPERLIMNTGLSLLRGNVSVCGRPHAVIINTQLILTTNYSMTLVSSRHDTSVIEKANTEITMFGIVQRKRL